MISRLAPPSSRTRWRGRTVPIATVYGGGRRHRADDGRRPGQDGEDQERGVGPTPPQWEDRDGDRDHGELERGVRQLP
ncbi:hypothetical protein ACWDHW_26075 [Streptomyces melanosporofaciens]|uniref:hypothetical protein n=1 Tax=unclassified Streptomyces TaxID=2593676 RepID=UPI00369C7864